MFDNITIINRGIVGKATDYARPGIQRKVISGFLCIALTLGMTAFTIYTAVAIPNASPAAPAVIALMGWMATAADPTTAYFTSWLFDNPDVFLSR